MRPMSSWKCLSLLSLGLLSACTLRPYYKQVLPPDAAQNVSRKGPRTQEVLLRLVDPKTNQPTQGGRVFLSTLQGRVAVTSDSEGLLHMPVTTDLLQENPLVEVVLPTGVERYVLQPVQAETPPAQL